MNDRREALRRNVVDSHLVTVDLAFQSGALLLDLSENGMGVQALSSAPIGNTTSLHFDLPETGGRVEAIGRIAWTDSSGRLGIRFEEVAEQGRVHLAQWLARERRPPAGNGSMPTWPPAHTNDEIVALRRELVTQKLEGDEALAFIVERTRSVTRATGAAVALEEDGNIVCRASSGNAPGIGAHLDPNSGLSGECVRTGEVVRCEDTETDPRADRLVCRKLELRSIVIVPIRLHGRSAGVLEAFSSRAHAFQSSDVLLLRRVADLVAGITVRQPDLGHPTPAGPHAVMASTQLEPLEPEPTVEPEPESETKTAPLMMEDILALDFLDSIPCEPIPPLDGIVTAPLPIMARPQTSAQPQAPITAPTPAVVEPPAETPKAIDRAMAEERTARVPTVAQFDLATLVRESEIEHAPAGAAVIPGIERAAPPQKSETAQATVVPYQHAVVPPPKMPEVTMPAAHSFAARSVPVVEDRPVKSDLSARVTTATAPAVAPARPKPVPVLAKPRYKFDARQSILREVARVGSQVNLRIVGAAILAAVLVFGGWGVWRAFAPSNGAPVGNELKPSQPGPDPMNSAVTTPPASVAPVTATPTPAPVTTTRVPAAKPAAKSSTPAPMPDEISTRTVNPKKAAEPVNAPPVSEAPKVSDRPKVEEPPVIGFISRPGVESSTISNMLRTPVAKPSLDPPPAVSQITGGKLLQRIEPVYPRTSSDLQGEVTLKAVVGKDGKVRSVKIIKGHAILAQAAATAVRRWRYEPFVLNGVPIEVENTIVVNFKSPTRN